MQSLKSLHEEDRVLRELSSISKTLKYRKLSVWDLSLEPSYPVSLPLPTKRLRDRPTQVLSVPCSSMHAARSHLSGGDVGFFSSTPPHAPIANSATGLLLLTLNLITNSSAGLSVISSNQGTPLDRLDFSPSPCNSMRVLFLYIQWISIWKIKIFEFCFSHSTL